MSSLEIYGKEAMIRNERTLNTNEAAGCWSATVLYDVLTKAVASNGDA